MLPLCFVIYYQKLGNVQIIPCYYILYQENVKSYQYQQIFDYKIINLGWESKYLIILTKKVIHSKGLMNAQSPTLKYNSKIGLKNKNDFNNYKSRSRSKLELQQWNLIQSRLMSPNMNINKQKDAQRQKEQNRNKDGLNMNSLSSQLKQTKSSRVQSNKDKAQATNGPVTYSDKIKVQFQMIQSENKTSEQLIKQIKSMRQMLIQLNSLVTLKLSKYQMAQFVPKGMAVSYEPQKQSQLLLAKIQNNTRILQSLQKQIKQIQHRDKELQQKDYLIDLQESANQIIKGIRENRRLRHLQGVTVDKLDGRLLEMRQAALDDQFKMVKVIKHNTLYYFKKFNQQKLILQELDKNIQQLLQKQQKITQKLNQHVKIAQQKHLLVKANRSYVEIKKNHEQLIVKIQQAKKKVDVSKRSKEVQSQKVERQNERIKRQINFIQSRLQEYQIRGQQVTNFTESMIQKNQIAPKLLNRISNKFTQLNIRQNSSSVTPKQVSQLQSSQNTSKDTSNVTLNIKPRLNLSKNNSPKKSQRYQTLSLQKSYGKINDKNQTIQFQQQKGRQYRIKPSMNIRKKNQNNNKLLESSINDKQVNKAEDPSVLKKIYNYITKKKDAESH